MYQTDTSAGVKNECAVCGVRIRWRSDGVCHRCYKKYVQEDGTYPEWLKFMIRDTKRELMSEYRRFNREVLVDVRQLDTVDEWYEESDDRWLINHNTPSIYETNSDGTKHLKENE